MSGMSRLHALRTSLSDGRELEQIVRFALVGIATNAVGYCLYVLVTQAGMGPKTTVSILYPIGALIGFAGNRQWTFTHRGHLLGSSLRYAAAHTLGYLLNILLLLIFVNRLHFPHQIVQAGAILVVAAFLFVAFRLFVFRPQPGSAEPQPGTSIK